MWRALWSWVVGLCWEAEAAPDANSLGALVVVSPAVATTAMRAEAGADVVLGADDEVEAIDFLRSLVDLGTVGRVTICVPSCLGPVVFRYAERRARAFRGEGLWAVVRRVDHGDDSAPLPSEPPANSA